MKQLFTTLHQFLHRNLLHDRPILVALSGGPDSLALFHLLLEYQQKESLSLGIAHVDHGWRPESKQEARQLAELADTFKIPYHLKTLTPNLLKGNLEEACRQERLVFFSILCKKYNYQAVLTAHHANDQAETVLKRVLEGANLTSLSGLQEITTIKTLGLCDNKEKDEVNLWRPLLKCAKSDILNWLEQKGLTAFDDKTNHDPKYLRARFRTKIIPYLNQAFGKDVQNNLCHFAEEANELQRYFQDKLKKYEVEVDEQHSKIFINLQEDGQGIILHPYELKMILKELLRNHHITASRQQLHLLTHLLQENKSNKQIDIDRHRFIVDRKRLFIFKENETAPQLSKKWVAQELTTGTWGEWNVIVTSCYHPRPNKMGWKNVWKGHVEISLPAAKNYLLGPPNLKKPYPHDSSSLDKWWTDEKVPAFLRSRIPVIWEGDKIRQEFLSLRDVRIRGDQNIHDWLHVTLTLNYL